MQAHSSVANECKTVFENIDFDHNTKSDRHHVLMKHVLKNIKTFYKVEIFEEVTSFGHLYRHCTIF